MPHTDSWWAWKGVFIFLREVCAFLTILESIQRSDGILALLWLDYLLHKHISINQVYPLILFSTHWPHSSAFPHKAKQPMALTRHGHATWSLSVSTLRTHKSHSLVNHPSNPFYLQDIRHHIMTSLTPNSRLQHTKERLGMHHTRSQPPHHLQQTHILDTVRKRSPRWLQSIGQVSWEAERLLCRVKECVFWRPYIPFSTACFLLPASFFGWVTLIPPERHSAVLKLLEFYFILLSIRRSNLRVKFL